MIELQVTEFRRVLSVEDDKTLFDTTTVRPNTLILDFSVKNRLPRGCSVESAYRGKSATKQQLYEWGSDITQSYLQLMPGALIRVRDVFERVHPNGALGCPVFLNY